MNGLDLFSGIGGLTLALEPWVRPVATVKTTDTLKLSCFHGWRTESCRSRQYGTTCGHWTVCGSMESGSISFTADSPARTSALQELVQAWKESEVDCFSKSYASLKKFNPLSFSLRTFLRFGQEDLAGVVHELARLGFDCRWTTVSAAEVGAPHLRKRWFLLAAHAERIGLRDESGRRRGPDGRFSPQPFNNGSQQSLADTNGHGQQRFAECHGQESSSEWTLGDDADGLCHDVADTSSERGFPRGFSVGAQSQIAKPHFKNQHGTRLLSWSTEPDVGRVAHGVPHRVDRLRGLGNSVVPLQAREAFMRLAGVNLE